MKVIMLEFFNGWRRKVGCVAMVMAMLICAAWTRSHAVSESVHAYKNTFLLSTPDLLSLATLMDDRSVHQRFEYHLHEENPLDIPNITWSRRFGVFGVGEIREQHLASGIADGEFVKVVVAGEIVTTVLSIPYWSLACPLTLISAYLILWKPRRRESTKPPRGLGGRVALGPG
jgi:hypothetical protein